MFFDTYINEDMELSFLQEQTELIEFICEAKSPEEVEQVLKKKLAVLERKVEKVNNVNHTDKENKCAIEYGLSLATLGVAWATIACAPTLSIICSCSSIVLSLLAVQDADYKRNKGNQLKKKLLKMKSEAKTNNLSTKQIDKQIAKCDELIREGNARREELNRQFYGDSKKINESCLFLN
jgi:hypothetical protein